MLVTSKLTSGNNHKALVSLLLFKKGNKYSNVKMQSQVTISIIAVIYRISKSYQLSFYQNELYMKTNLHNCNNADSK